MQCMGVGVGLLILIPEKDAGKLQACCKLCCSSLAVAHAKPNSGAELGRRAMRAPARGLAKAPRGIRHTLGWRVAGGGYSLPPALGSFSGRQKKTHGARSLGKRGRSPNRENQVVDRLLAYGVAVRAG
jgi:hypothetical protein